MFWIYIYIYIYIYIHVYIYYIYYQEHILPGYPPGLIPPAVGVSSGSTLLSQLMARKALELPEQSEHVTTTCREVCWMGGTIPILWSFTQIYIYICISVYLSIYLWDDDRPSTLGRAYLHANIFIQLEITIMLKSPFFATSSHCFRLNHHTNPNVGMSRNFIPRPPGFIIIQQQEWHIFGVFPFVETDPSQLCLFEGASQ